MTGLLAQADPNALLKAPPLVLALSVAFLLLVLLLSLLAVFRAPLAALAGRLAESAGLRGRMPPGSAVTVGRARVLRVPPDLSSRERPEVPLSSAFLSERVYEWLLREREAAISGGAKELELRLENENYLGSYFWTGLATFAVFVSRENQIAFRVVYNGNSRALMSVEALELLNRASGGSVAYIDAARSDRFRKEHARGGA